jgi:hypothetical protein
MKKRIKLLGKYQGRLELAWDKLLKVLKMSDNNDQEIINQSVKSLVGQRLFLESEIENGRKLL